MLNTKSFSNILNRSLNEQKGSLNVRMAEGFKKPKYKVFNQNDIDNLVNASNINHSKYVIIPEYADLSELSSIGVSNKTTIISPNNKLPKKVFNCWVGGNSQIPAFTAINNSTFKGVVTALEDSEKRGTVKIKSSIINSIQTKGVIVAHGCAIADVLYCEGFKSTESVIQNIATSGNLVLTDNSVIVGEQSTVANSICVKGNHNIIAGVVDGSVEFKIDEDTFNNSVVVGQLNDKAQSAVVRAGTLNSFDVDNPFNYLVNARKSIIKQLETDSDISLQDLNHYDLSKGLNSEIELSNSAELDYQSRRKTSVFMPRI